MFNSIKRNYNNAGAKISAQFLVESRGEEKYQLYHFSATGLQVHNKARSAKRLLLKILKQDHGARNPRGRDIYANKWDVFVRSLLNAQLDYREGRISQLDYETIMEENLSALIEEAFDEFEDGDILTVTCWKNTTVEVDAFNPQSFKIRSKALGNINIDAERRSLNQSLKEKW